MLRLIANLIVAVGVCVVVVWSSFALQTVAFGLLTECPAPARRLAGTSYGALLIQAAIAALFTVGPIVAAIVLLWRFAPSAIGWAVPGVGAVDGARSRCRVGAPDLRNLRGTIQGWRADFYGDHHGRYLGTLGVRRRT